MSVLAQTNIMGNSPTTKIPAYQDHIWLCCADEEGKPYATVAFKDGYISCLLVDSAYRKQGIGKKLLEDIERLAREKGVKRLSAITHPNNIPAQRLFESMGFTKWIKYKKEIK